MVLISEGLAGSRDAGEALQEAGADAAIAQTEQTYRQPLQALKILEKFWTPAGFSRPEGLEGPGGCWRPLEALLDAPLKAPGGPWRPLEAPGGPLARLRFVVLFLSGATVSLAVGRQASRPGSTCTIDVEGHKRRPPSKVGGLCHEFRV